jgi:hypothetical protein
MFWGKKEEKKKLPDLPAFKQVSPGSPQPVFPEPQQEEDHQALPAFPDSPGSNKFSQAAIKDAVSTNEPQEDEKEGKSTKKISVVEMDGDWAPSMNRKGRAQEDEDEGEDFPIAAPPSEMPMSKFSYSENTSKPKHSIAKGSDVFVKIDKYHTLRKMLDEAKSKLEEMDSLIKNIRETKLREEQELAGWEKEIMHAKSQVQQVSQTIFEKVD